MRKIVSILLVAGLAACAGTAPEFVTPAMPTPTPLANFEAVTPPPYDDDRGARHESSREEYDAARADTRFVMEQFTYPSDDLTVGAYLYRPRVREAARRPILVFNRGGYTRQAFSGEILVLANRFAQAGFIVVAPHYRGSVGADGRDELGGADLDDLMNIVPQLSRIEGGDPARVFIAGESRGGMMTYQALRDGFPARAAAVWGAFTDLEALIVPGGAQAEYAPMIWPDIAQNRAAIIERRSALHWANRIRTPVLIMHGGADEDIPIDQSRRMDAELTRLGLAHNFIVFEGQEHVIGGRSAERDAATIAWFRRFGAR